MKITALKIKNLRQFKDLRLDFIDPDSGTPLEKACFIGSNGTGKTTLLGILAGAIRGQLATPLTSSGPVLLDDGSQVAVKLSDHSASIWCVGIRRGKQAFFREEIEDAVSWEQFWDKGYEASDSGLPEVWRPLFRESCRLDKLPPEFALQDNSTDLAIFAPPDGSSLRAGTLPQASLNESLELLKSIPAFHISSYDDVQSFWKFFIYQIKKRESDEKAFQKRADIRSMTVEAAEKAFSEEYPEILVELASVWNRILDRAGLEFDVDHAKIPVQLNENLEAYIKSKSTDAVLTYNLLSTGIRNFLFRVGHVYSLYFHRNIQRGFLLVDEPEISLFPDLLYGIVDQYLGIIQNTQFFAATHSPIVAGQFKAQERFILRFGDDGYLTCDRGISPEGDDPNDLLVRDFGVRSIYGKKGVEQYKRYLELRRLIKIESDATARKKLLDEYSEIGHRYNFGSNEVFG